MSGMPCNINKEHVQFTKEQEVKEFKKAESEIEQVNNVNNGGKKMAKGEQGNEKTNQHKRIAMGEKVTGLKKGGNVAEVKKVIKKK